MRRLRNKGDKLRYTVVREKAFPYHYVLSVWKGKTIYRVHTGTKAEMQSLASRYKSEEKKNPRPGLPGQRVVRGRVITIRNAAKVEIARLADGRIGILTVRKRENPKRIKSAPKRIRRSR